MKKYELTNASTQYLGKPLYRIKALKDFGSVRKGDLGGHIECERNLSHIGNAWVSDNAWVYGNACVSGNAWVSGNADFSTISGYGSEHRHTTFFRCADSCIRVNCGCFSGTLEEFRAKVKETHGNSKYAKEYLMLADLMELHLAKEEDS